MAFGKTMSHTIKDKGKLLARVRRIRGQAEAVERALEAELGCTDVLMLVASMRGAINGLTAEVMEDHIRHHVVDPAHEPDPERAKGAAELIEVLRTYLK
jgi:DNA-binding FrmR family transcriptional regulator